jgi:hypothetical protein
MAKMLLLAILLSSSAAYGQATPAPTPGSDQAQPLNAIIQEVESALNKYQDNLGSGATNQLPKLQSAEFDFKTSTAKTIGFSLNLFIFKFGTSHENDTVNDVTYTYKVKQPPAPSGLESEKAPPTFEDELLQTIQQCAKAMKTAKTVAGVPFQSLTVNLQYGVKWDINAAGNVTYSFVTVGLSGDKSKNTVQSVKLVFAD